MIRTTIFDTNRKLGEAWLVGAQSLLTWPARQSTLRELKKDLTSIRKHANMIEWANVNYIESTVYNLEKQWGKLREESIAGLTIKEFNTYSQVRKVCLAARKSLNNFYDDEISKETLTAYLLDGKSDVCDSGSLYVMALNGNNRNYGVLRQIARHYNIKDLQSGTYLMYAPYWLMRVSALMNMSIYGDSGPFYSMPASLDYFLTDSPDVTDTVKMLWDPWSEGPLNSIRSLGEAARLLCG